MSMTTEKEYEHIGETRGCADHDHDLVHELSRRLDSVWRYDQYIANADGRADLQEFWRQREGPGAREYPAAQEAARAARPEQLLLRTLNKRGLAEASLVFTKREGKNMGTTELIILIVVLLILFGGGGGYYWRRRGH